jgi:hypothetical protein
MGQYWKVVNLDKREFVHPHKLGTGLKLWEQVAGHPGTGVAMIILCAAMPHPRGSGDLNMDDDIARRTIGRWAGDRVCLVGDYAKDSDMPGFPGFGGLYGLCMDADDETNDETNDETEPFTDISDDVAHVIEVELDGAFEVDGGWRKFRR